MKVKTTNAEKIASRINELGANKVLLHTIPGTQFWLSCVKKRDGTWDITMCHPLQTRSYLIAKGISDKDHEDIWNQLVHMELTKRIRKAVKTLRNTIEHYLQNRIANQNTTEYSIPCHPYQSDAVLKTSLKVARGALKEIISNHNES